MGVAEAEEVVDTVAEKEDVVDVAVSTFGVAVSSLCTACTHVPNAAAALPTCSR